MLLKNIFSLRNLPFSIGNDNIKTTQTPSHPCKYWPRLTIVLDELSTILYTKFFKHLLSSPKELLSCPGCRRHQQSSNYWSFRQSVADRQQSGSFTGWRYRTQRCIFAPALNVLIFSKSLKPSKFEWLEQLLSMTSNSSNLHSSSWCYKFPKIKQQLDPAKGLKEFLLSFWGSFLGKRHERVNLN